MQWHHIVGQNPSNIYNIGWEKIHHTDNLIRVTASEHAAINAHYESRPPNLGGETVREWLSHYSYDDQHEYAVHFLRGLGISI